MAGYHSRGVLRWELQGCHWHAAEAEPSLQGVAEGVDATERRRRPLAADVASTASTENSNSTSYWY